MKEEKKGIISSNTVKPRGFDFEEREYGGFTKMKTNPKKRMITTTSMEMEKRNKKRQILMGRRRVQAQARRESEIAAAVKATKKLKEPKKPKETEDLGTVVEKAAEDVVEEVRPKETTASKKKKEEEPKIEK